MILQASLDAPVLLRFGADALLFTHIAGGGVGMAAGLGAMLARKGSRTHRLAGKAYVAGMLAMASVAAPVAPFIADPPGERWTNTAAAIFTFYLVVTAWAAGRRSETGVLERVMSAAPASLALSAAPLVLYLLVSREKFAGLEPFWVIAGVSALAWACDRRVIRAGAIVGPRRMARHVWRMSLSWFLAVGSFFLGQMKFLPAEVRDTALPFLPVLLVVGLGVFWTLRVRFPRRRRRALATA